MTRFIIGDRGTGKTRALARWVLAGKPLDNNRGWSRVILVGTASEQRVAVREVTREIFGGTHEGRANLLALLSKPSKTSTPGVDHPVQTNVNRLVQVLSQFQIGHSPDVEVAIDNAELLLKAMLDSAFGFNSGIAVMALTGQQIDMLGTRTSVRPSAHGEDT